MRSTLALLTLVAALPLSAQGNDPLAFLRPTPYAADGPAQTYHDAAGYRPVRPGEVRSAGFLTEMRNMPFGQVLGPVAAPVMHNTESSETALPGAVIAVLPPPGAAYQRGDTVMLARLVPAPLGWGSIVVPTALARIGDHTPRQTMATIIAMYGQVIMGQVVLPLEPFTNPGAVQPVPVDGPTGTIIIGSETRELEQVGGILFINVGSGAGMRLGDFIQVRRHAGPRLNAADTIDDIMALAQVVRVGAKSSTIRLVKVMDPDIRAGAPVVRIATLPG
jgi:hypothetical protein